MRKHSLAYLACLLAFAPSAALAQPGLPGEADPAAQAETPAAQESRANAARASRKIKEHTAYAGPTDMPGNPFVTYKVSITPGGHVTALNTLRSSGIEEFDAAVAKGIIRASPLPVPDTGPLVREFVIKFNMRER